MTFTLQLRELAVEKAYRSLFPPVSLELLPGQILHVAGANGSGKTTLLRALAGLNQRYQGDILNNGRAIRQQLPYHTQQLLFIGHNAAIKPQLSATENLDWYMACDNAKPEQVIAAMKALGIYSKRDLACFQLSAGQKRRVALCRLLFNRSPLWILDEPLTALDVDGLAVIRNAIATHQARGGMTVLTTHHGADELGLDMRRLTLSRKEWQLQ